MTESPQASRVRNYIERVVNRRDLSAVDEFIADDYTGGGHGWPSTLTELRTFYESQALARPDWRIEIQELVEVDDCVVVRAHAGGTLHQDDAGRPLGTPTVRKVEWLAAYWIRNAHISRIELLALTPRRGQ